MDHYQALLNLYIFPQKGSCGIPGPLKFLRIALQVKISDHATYPDVVVPTFSSFISISEIPEPSIDEKETESSEDKGFCRGMSQELNVHSTKDLMDTICMCNAWKEIKKKSSCLHAPRKERKNCVFLF